MKAVQFFVLIVLSICTLPSYLLAADESEEDASEEVATDENSGIVSQSSPIEGYQPFTVAGQEIEATYLE